MALWIPSLILFDALPSPAEVLWHDAGDDNPFTFSLDPTGRAQPLRLPLGGRRLRPGDVERLYGAAGGFRVLDEGLDVASAAWAETGNFRSPRRVRYQDLSDAAGWPGVHVPGGFIALDPVTGRLKFSEGNPGQPLERVSVSRTPHGTPSGVLLHGRYAYLSNGGSCRGFQVIDVSDPLLPETVSAIDVGHDLRYPPQLLGDLAFVSSSDNGLLAVNVSNPRHPRISGQFCLRAPATTGAFVLCGPWAYVHVGWEGPQPPDPAVAGWHVLDLTQAHRPLDLGLMDPTAAAPGLFHRGVAYRTGEKSLDILDITNPLRPKTARSLPLPGKPLGAAVSSDFFYVLLQDHRVVIVFAGRFEQERLAVTPPLAGLGGSGGFAAEGKRLYISQRAPEGKKEQPGLLIYDLENPARPRRLARLTGRHFDPAQISVEGGRVVATDGNFGLWCLDTRETLKRALDSKDGEVRLFLPHEEEAGPDGNRQPAGLCHTAGEIQSLRLSGDLAIASLERGGTEALFDVRDPLRPLLKGFWRNGLGSVTDLAAGTCFYNKAWEEAFYRFVDATDPARPREAGRLGLGFSCPMRAAGHLGYLLVNGQHEGQPATFLEVYDLRRPAAPFRLGLPSRLPPDYAGPYSDSLATTTRLYAVKNGGVAILGVLDPYRPVPQGRIEDAEIRVPAYSWQGSGRVLGLHGFRLYLLQGVEADNNQRLLVYDVSDPAAASRVATFPLRAARFTRGGHERRPLPQGAFIPDFFIDGDFLYAADYWGGVKIYDLRADPIVHPAREGGFEARDIRPGAPDGDGADDASSARISLDDAHRDFFDAADAPSLLDNESAPDEHFEDAPDRSARGTPDDLTVPGYDVIGWNIGELHGDVLLCPKLAGLHVYRARRSPERPSGDRLVLEEVPEWERFRDVITHVESSMVSLEAASAAAILIRQRGRTLLEWYRGRHNSSPASRAVDARSRFPIWSVTKAYVATALGLAIDAGKVSLDDSVHRVVPELTGQGRERVTFRHLATHTSGLPGDGDWRTVKLASPPGEKLHYSNPGMDLLAFAMARILGEDGFGQLMKHRLFEPMGLSESGFLSPGDDETEIVPAVKSPQDAGWLDPWGPEGRGMAGLYVSARDLAALGEMYLNRGRWKGKQILSTTTVRLLTSPQVRGPLRQEVPDRACAWLVAGDWRSSELPDTAPAGTFGHGGGTHCYVLVCPALDLVAVKLLNRGYWPASFDYAGDYRRFGDLVLEAVR
ncbi:MAG: serine hydrolase [Planctomycetes bacterium]|nr:serine hydrolase [Planctomycetota bacterium]